MAKYEAVAFETKRYTLVVEAESEEDAWSKADRVEDLMEWDEDLDYYDISMDHVEQIDDE